MTKKIIAFGASNSKQSINKKFATFAANQLNDVEVSILDLRDFELPIYSFDLEKESGVPEHAIRFSKLIRESDGVIISLAEHNGLFTSVFKNLWDWMSRINTRNIWHDKAVFLLGTSPGKNPESNVMKISKDLFPLFGAHLVSSFHLPSFNHFFDEGAITDSKQQELFTVKLQKFQTYLNEN
ncbi:NADPH-dependent FMN reductase [Leeuwenhoekiella marinoflava]|uniref:NAD(P)H-dependent FMN reductase n=2 Tax=Leeuwenhoekiella marinoflava TaxID=988 RepID=A0A4Q0PFT3_9FLAO|nr:NAD(P)H-dependent oxidoreductase [Leeuwenhoekiella marinoflava]RXG25458.1 NAD(P)H-dependent FMN reductase [Leeuwenhoekiella marinoflava]SHF86422.1 NAD(P)H-dependent FMN reductase [Leeuwenhoekiella marinoflava DSM 3653]